MSAAHPLRLLLVRLLRAHRRFSFALTRRIARSGLSAMD